mmetsp:Transcript_5033/g.15081  ORF Transcript_5033/g.15081 Transcript_5033/m.15081 type:complete len:278 (-) Transcript_5033:889-1722(-)
MLQSFSSEKPAHRFSARFRVRPCSKGGGKIRPLSAAVAAGFTHHVPDSAPGPRLRIPRSARRSPVMQPAPATRPLPGHFPSSCPVWTLLVGAVQFSTLSNGLFRHRGGKPRRMGAYLSDHQPALYPCTRPDRPVGSPCRPRRSPQFSPPRQGSAPPRPMLCGVGGLQASPGPPSRPDVCRLAQHRQSSPAPRPVLGRLRRQETSGPLSARLDPPVRSLTLPRPRQQAARGRLRRHRLAAPPLLCEIRLLCSRLRLWNSPRRRSVQGLRVPQLSTELR